MITNDAYVAISANPIFVFVPYENQGIIYSLNFNKHLISRILMLILHFPGHMLWQSFPHWPNSRWVRPRQELVMNKIKYTINTSWTNNYLLIKQTQALNIP